LTSPANGGSLVVGNVARSLTIPQSVVTCLDGDNTCHLARLPANTMPTTLPSWLGNQSLVACSGTPRCQTSTPIPLQGNAQWQNVLLGQTVTLTLNTRLSPTLLDFTLPARLCTQNGTFTIPVSVLAALNNSTCNGGYGQTVRGLLYLANQALAGQGTCNASLTDINTAVSSINNGFDSSKSGCVSVCPQ
jgi:hypothetical protein